jgi:hypothetical protein
MIFIAYNHKSQVISIVNAKNQELANAYWQGANVDVHASKCLETDFTSLDEHPTGVFPILKTHELSGHQLFPSGRIDDRKFLLILTL